MIGSGIKLLWVMSSLYRNEKTIRISEAISSTGVVTMHWWHQWAWMSKLIVGVSVALLLQGCATDEGVEICQKDLIEKLKAPSTLQLITAYRGEMPPIDHEATIARLERLTKQEEARFEELSEADRYFLAYRKNVHIPEMKAKHDPAITPSYSIVLTYDAENSFGAPLRGHHWCWVGRFEHGDGLFDSEPIAEEEFRSTKALMKEVPVSWWPL